MAAAHEGLLSSFLRRRRILEALRHLSGRVLDYGCGVGELAGHVLPDLYLGVDKDESRLDAARRRHPGHRFLKADKPQQVDAGHFDTIVLLAVIEHVPAPAEFLAGLAGLLTEHGHLVVSTPHPSYDAIYEFGVKLGFFSHTALEEHQDLIGLDQMQRICSEAGLSVAQYRRFLFFANQLFLVQPLRRGVTGRPVNRPSGALRLEGLV